jgi:hypothetical protein
MSLAIETMAPQLVIRAPLRRRVTEERTGACDFVWACLLDDYLENDITEFSDDNSNSTADILRAERRKLKKMKKRESKLRKKLADKFNIITEEGEEQDDASDAVDLSRTMGPKVDSILENRDAFETLYLEVMNSLSDDHEQSRERYLPPSVVQQRRTLATDDHPELEDAVGSRKTIVARHTLADSGESSFSTNEMRGRSSLGLDAVGGATPNLTPDRKEITRSETGNKTIRDLYEDREGSRSLHGIRGTTHLGHHEVRTSIQPPVIAAAAISSTKHGSKITRMQPPGAIPSKGAVPTRFPTETIGQIPSSPATKPTFKPPRPPLSDERVAAENSAFYDGSKDNPIDIINAESTNAWQPKSDLSAEAQWQRWREKKAKLVTRTNLAHRIPRDSDTSNRPSRVGVAASVVSQHTRDSSLHREVIGSNGLIEGDEDISLDLTRSSLLGSRRSQMDDIRRKKLDRKEAILRIKAIKARIAQMDP